MSKDENINVPPFIDTDSLYATSDRINLILSFSFKFQGSPPPLKFSDYLLVERILNHEIIPFPDAATYLTKIKQGRA